MEMKAWWKVGKVRHVDENSALMEREHSSG
jgi:hypothetical protein